MSRDVRELLRDTAVTPTRPLDAAAVVGKARRQSRVARAVSAGGALVLVTLVAVGIGQLWGGGEGAPQIAHQPPVDHEPDLTVRIVTVADAVAEPGDDLWIVGRLDAYYPGPARLCSFPDDPYNAPRCAEPSLEVVWQAEADMKYVGWLWWQHEWAFRGDVTGGQVMIHEVRTFDAGTLGPAPPASVATGETGADTPRGDARVRLTVVPAETDPHGHVIFYLTNLGDVPLVYGYEYRVERWDGQDWTRVPFPDGYGWDDIGLGVEPGESGEPQRWPPHDFDVGPVEPGRYRIVVEPRWEDEDTYQHPDMRLPVHAEFEVRR